MSCAIAADAQRQGTASAVPKRPAASGVLTPEAGAMLGRPARGILPKPNFLRAFAILAFASLLVSGCGYHVAGRDSKLPSGWKAISIPAFKNDTTQY
ncbi:MAG: hypothetical protein ACRD4M_12505, partial [Candidatus Acidiferrales bacterium]